MRIPDIIKVGVPIAVSLIALLFGAFQYFDKRDLEQTLQNQLIEQNAAALIVHYMQTDLARIWRGDQDLSTGAIRWLASEYETLELGQLDLIETANLGAISDAISTQRHAKGLRIDFFVIRNGGRARAIQISLTYEQQNIDGTLNNPYTLPIDAIEPGSGVALVVTVSDPTGQPISPMIIPRTLSYIDASTGRTVEHPVRGRLEHPRLRAPGIIFKG